MQAALADRRVATLSETTLSSGERLSDLLTDRSAFEGVDADRAGERSYGFVRLALEHLIGAR